MSIRGFTAGVVGILAAATAMAAPAARRRADPPVVRTERVSGLADADKLKRADEAIDRMKELLRQVLSRLEDARNEKDVVRLNCINEKLTQMKALLKVAEQSDVALQEAAARRDEATEAEFQKISIAKVKVEQLRADTEECIGQLAFVVDEKTTVEVETPRDLPLYDLTRRSPPPPPVARPPPASRFE